MIWMLTTKKAIIIPVILIILATAVIGPLSGCSKKNTVPTTTNSNLNEIHYIATLSNDDTAETRMLVSRQANMIPTIGSVIEAEKLMGEKNVQVLHSEKGSFTINCVFFNMRRSPSNDYSFREAISRVVNREYLANTVLKGMAVPCSTFIPPLADSWTNKEVTAPAFDSIQAAKMLNDAGYRYDKDAKSRIDPVTNKPLHLTILTPLQSEKPVLWDIGYMLTYYLNELGIKADHIALPDYLFVPRSMQSRDYDILIQDVFLAQAPFGLYPLLHSSRDQDWTNAFSGIHDSALDADLAQLWSGLDLVAAQKASYNIQARLAKSLPYVVVCSVPVFSAVNGQWDGIVTMPGIGSSNIWTYQAIHPTAKSQNNILQLTAPGGFNSLNPLVANNTNEWSVLQQIYSPLFYSNPVTMKDTPVLASKWDVEAWTTPTGGKGMKVTFHLVDGIKWQDGVPFTSQDIKFCIDFIKTHGVPKFENITNLVDHVQTPDKLTVEIYLNDSGYRYLYDLAWLTFMPQHIWSDVTDYQAFKPWTEVNPTNKDLTKLVGQGPYILKLGNLSNGVQIYRNQNAYMAKP